MTCPHCGGTGEVAAMQPLLDNQRSPWIDNFESTVLSTPEDREKTRRWYRTVLTMPPGARIATVSRVYASSPWSNEFNTASVLAETGHLGDQP